MLQRRKLRLLAALLLISLAFLVFCPRKHALHISFDLSGQDKVEFVEASASGTNVLYFHDGISLKRILYSFGAHPIQRFGWYRQTFSCPVKNGGFGIEMLHFNKNGPLIGEINGSTKFVQLVSSNNQVQGFRRLVLFGGNRFGPSAPMTEEIYWVFPRSDERDLHLRLYYTNLTTQLVETNDFSIPNPAFR